jgi:hypothetical protein
MTASLVATSSIVAFFLGRGEFTALTVATESVDRTDSKDTATTSADLSDVADVSIPALEDFVGSAVSGSLEGLASSSDGAVVVDTRVVEVSGVTELDAAGMGDGVVTLVAAWSLGLLVVGTKVVGADDMVGLTYARFSRELCKSAEFLVDSTSGLALFLEDSESCFEEESVTDIFCSVTLLEFVFAGSEPDGALVLLLFDPGLEPVCTLDLVLFTSASVFLLLLAGGSGGFPANSLGLLFFRKTPCCLLTAGDGPFFWEATLLFFLAGDGSREGAGDLRALAAGGRGMREGEGCASFSPATGRFPVESSRCLLTLIFLPFLGEGGLLRGGKSFLICDNEARRCWVRERFLAGEGSRDTGCDRGIRDFPGGGTFLISPGDDTRIDLADPGS